MEWSLHPQLAQDTVPVGDLALTRVLLTNDANFPWLILVPRRSGLTELIDLEENAQVQLLGEVAAAARVLKSITACDKLNIAALGNQVPQLHVHVIARRHSDAAWPKPVWGVVPPAAYDAKIRDGLIGALRRGLQIKPVKRLGYRHGVLPMTFRIAVVQPIANPIAQDERNVDDAVNFIARAKNAGADFVCFPETYPGPWRMPAAFDPTPRIAEAAAKHDIIAIYGTIEPLSHNEGTAHNLICMAYGDGRAPVSYRRTHPNGPWIYTGGKWWEFQYVPGNEFPVFDTPHGKVGLAMCSEAYMPEVTRALALRGAELIFMPAGTDKGKLWASWRNLIWSRAIENLAIVVTTQNLFSPAERGLAMVAAPEEILFESTVSGLFFVDVSLDRTREMRASTDTVTSSQSYAAKQGVLGPQWQRPELRELMYPRSPYAAE